MISSMSERQELYGGRPDDKPSDMAPNDADLPSQPPTPVLSLPNGSVQVTDADEEV